VSDTGAPLRRIGGDGWQTRARERETESGLRRRCLVRGPLGGAGADPRAHYGLAGTPGRLSDWSPQGRARVADALRHGLAELDRTPLRDGADRRTAAVMRDQHQVWLASATAQDSARELDAGFLAPPAMDRMALATAPLADADDAELLASRLSGVPAGCRAMRRRCSSAWTRAVQALESWQNGWWPCCGPAPALTAATLVGWPPGRQRYLGSTPGRPGTCRRLGGPPMGPMTSCPTGWEHEYLPRLGRWRLLPAPTEDGARPGVVVWPVPAGRVPL
jgi:uncharacterized protein DUF885